MEMPLLQWRPMSNIVRNRLYDNLHIKVEEDFFLIYQSCTVLVFYQDSDCSHPVAICFLNTLLLEYSHTHICWYIFPDCFHGGPEEMRNSQSLKYELTDHQQKKVCTTKVHFFLIKRKKQLIRKWACCGSVSKQCVFINQAWHHAS